MDEANVRYLLSNLKIPHQRATFTGSKQRTRWMTISCPFAPWTHAKRTDTNPSFGITLKEGDRSAYKCLSCGMKGRLAGLPTRLGGYRKVDYSKLRAWAESVEFSASISKPLPKWEEADPVAIDYNIKHSADTEVRGHVDNFPRALGLSYLRKRGLTFQDILRLDLRYDADHKRVLFPVYDHNDKFRGFTGRSIMDLKKWTKEIPKVKDYYGLNKREVFLHLKGKHEGIKLIGEGLFDFATFVRHGYLNSRAILGTALTPEKVALLIDEAEPVYFFMDNDLAGWQALFGVFKPDGELDTDNAWAFQLYREVPVWIVPYRTDLTGEDPGSIMDKKAFDRMIRNAWLFTGKAPLDNAGAPSTRRPNSV